MLTMKPFSISAYNKFIHKIRMNIFLVFRIYLILNIGNNITLLTACSTVNISKFLNLLGQIPSNYNKPFGKY